MASGKGFITLTTTVMLMKIAVVMKIKQGEESLRTLDTHEEGKRRSH